MRISDWSSDVCSSDLQAGFVEGPERRQRRAEHRPTPFAEPVLVAGFVVGEIIGPRRAAERGDDAARYVIDMDAAEDLSGQVDPVCAAFADTVEDRTPGAVDAGQAKDAHVAAQRRPSRISRVAIGAAALDRRAFVDPRAACVAINAGR